MLITQYIFWEPTLSPHKSDFFRALARQVPDVDILCIAEVDLLPERKAMGWSIPKNEGYRFIIAPNIHELKNIVHTNSLHIFSGIRHVPTIVTGLRFVIKEGLPFGIMSEPRVNEGFKGFLRYIQSWVSEYNLRKTAAFILAIGRSGPPWFKSVGYPNEKIFPFAYFVDQKAIPNEYKTGNKLRIAFVGRVCRAKGVDYLVDAMKLLPNAQLQIVGNGELVSLLKKKVDAENLNVEFLGFRNMSEIPGILANVDLVVLPSITSDDGWGVVVNEALFAGAAVLVTNKVGASILLNKGELGVVVSPNSSNSIAEGVQRLQSAGLFTAEARSYRTHVAEKTLTGIAGSDYFLKIMNHVFEDQPRPPPFYL